MEYIRTPKVENVRLLNNHSRSHTPGTLYLTATHLIFVDNAKKKELWLVHTHIQNLEKLSITQDGSPLRIRCKTFQVLVFLISQERDCHDLYSSLVKLSKPEPSQALSQFSRIHLKSSDMKGELRQYLNTSSEYPLTIAVYVQLDIWVHFLVTENVKMEELYAFSYNPREEQTISEGWDLFSLNNDYLQMGLPTRFWKISRINNEFGLCATYPKLLCVPSLATPALMMGSAAFRSKRRLPVLSYLHKNGAVIVRCSQPLAGLRNARSIEDEAFVDLIRRSKSKSNDFMYIVDTRPVMNAYANRVQGKGFENTDNYENIKYLFLGIDNIHVMRSSLNKLLDACEDSSCSASSWLEAVGDSGWLKHVHSVIQVSRFIANAVGVENRSVLVHCSDGWDRTAQTCSLASIMLNPHYRTIDGFLALVQKEWLHFGHKFEHRCGHLDGDGREVSPVFTQFIDAVWQLMRLKPSYFQFNEQFLFDINDHVYSCQFGTFLGNCPKVRQDFSLATRTYSLWGWMIKRTHLYSNPLFRAADQHKPENQLLLPPTNPQFVKFWLGMYNRFDKGLQPRESIAAAMKGLNAKAADLSTTVAEVRNRRDKLREKLGMEIPSADSRPVATPDADTTNALLKRLTVSKKSPQRSPVLQRRPASTDNMLALDKKKLLLPTVSASQSNPNLARPSGDSPLNPSPLGDAVVDSSALVVSFKANHFSDDNHDVTPIDDVSTSVKLNVTSDVSPPLQDGEKLMDTRVN